MKFKKGDRVEVIWRSELHQGLVEEVIELTDELMVRLDNQLLRVDYLFNQNQVRKVKLVKVPQFVADAIDTFKDEGDGLAVAIDYEVYTDELIEELSLDIKMRGWLWEVANQELFARAWLDGYEVEQEPLYYVKLADSGLDYLNVNKETGQKHVANNEELTSYKTRFTESEIKDINENYWAFRVPVEEVEGE
ncbi:DUF1642 domain-containing protein [Listeria monocytogenes]|nr:DUF1642 domain-containing protein [Listeria monocytogenes]